MTANIVTLVRTRVVELLTSHNVHGFIADLVLARVDSLPYIDDASYLTAFQAAMADVSREIDARTDALKASTSRQQAEHDALMQFYAAVTSDTIH